jgi:hypothetical protein
MEREFGYEKKAITVIYCIYSSIKFVGCADRLSTFSLFGKGQRRGFAVGICSELRGSRVARQYHVKGHARRGARGKSNLAGLIISEISDPFFPDVTKGVEVAAAELEAGNFCFATLNIALSA